MCFQRDSRKDQIIVWGFILGTAGLLGWAGAQRILEFRAARSEGLLGVRGAGAGGAGGGTIGGGGGRSPGLGTRAVTGGGGGGGGLPDIRSPRDLAVRGEYRALGADEGITTGAG